MKTTHATSLMNASRNSAWLGIAIRIILTALGWALLAIMTVLTGYFTGWVFLAVSLLGKAPIHEVILVWLVLLALTGGLGWLVARFVASARSVGLVLGVIFGLILVTWLVWSWSFADQALFLARQVAWGESTVKDYEKFPERTVTNAAPTFYFKQDLSPELFQMIEYRSEGELKQKDFEDFLQSTQTTSFILIKDDAILYEGYFNGYSRDSIVTSFSIAKSFTSALVGIAIDEGYIESLDESIIAYLPELKGKGLDDVTIRDLLLMSAGISFVTDDEASALAQLTQFTDEGLSYSYPNLRDLALQVKPDGQAPGTEFNYNNYHPVLLGMILERTTGRPVTEYLEDKIWKPLGTEYLASWSLDSEKSGFEMMQSGINARAIDFAKFGRLFLNNGNWNGAKIISPEWVVESTSPDPNDQRLWHSNVDWKDANGYYKFLWWGRNNPDGSYDYAAQGHLGQWIYVSPKAKMIIVRFGLNEGGVDNWADVFQTIIANVRDRD